MVPATVEVTESSKTGVVNAPVELLSWATKRLPAVNVPVTIYGILIVAPIHTEVGEMAPVVIVCAIPVVKIITSMVSNKIPFFIFIFFIYLRI